MTAQRTDDRLGRQEHPSQGAQHARLAHRACAATIDPTSGSVTGTLAARPEVKAERREGAGGEGGRRPAAS